MSMQETALRIRIFGDQVLRQRAKNIEQILPEHGEILSQMARMMYDSSGIGLAAPQLGLNIRMIVVDIGSGLFKLINPEILKRSGSSSIEEGCLSVPGISVCVRRAEKITLKALDENGKQVNIEAEGLLATVFQHELDHVNGKLIVDYLPFLQKIKMRSKFKKLKEKNERLSESAREPEKLQL